MSYTPGPWDLIQHGEKDSRVGRRTLLAIVYSEAYQDRKNQEANARLIAAAPDLLEACKAMLADPLAPVTTQSMQAARIAIAKAEAQSPETDGPQSQEANK